MFGFRPEGENMFDTLQEVEPLRVIEVPDLQHEAMHVPLCTQSKLQIYQLTNIIILQE